MEYRKLGWSKLRVPVLCLGGNIFGHFCNETETIKIINYAFEQGINFIDTANVYSDGISETYIGKAIKWRREKFIIATKAGVRSDQKPDNILTREYILKSFEESLWRLQTDYIDIYQMHHFDASVPLGETLSTLNELLDSRKVRYIGCSNYSLEQLRKAASFGFKNIFVSLQLPYNILDQGCEREILFCEEAGMGILTYHSLARGLLTGKYNNGAFPEHARASTSSLMRKQMTSENLVKVNKLIELAAQQGHSATELALSWLLQRKEISSVIIGVRSIEQLQGCISAIDWKLSSEEMTTVKNIVSF